MRIGIMTREYRPYLYGGAGVRAKYISHELARSIEVEVHTRGDQSDITDHNPLKPLSALSPKMRTTC